MNTTSGLILAKKIRNDAPHALIVFITNYSQYVYDVFDVITFDFIIKPVSFERFEKLIQKVVDYLHICKRTFLCRYRKNSYSIPCQEITYIQKVGRKAFIHTNSEKTYQCNITLDEIWNQLDDRVFAPIYISCIVNLAEISEVVCDKIVLKSGEILYIGRNYRQKIKQCHLRFLKEQI